MSVTLTLSGGSFSMHASGSGARAHGTFFFAYPPPNFYVLDEGGGEGVPASLTLSGGGFSNHASGTGARAHNRFSSRLGSFHFSEAGAAIDGYVGSLP